MAEWIMIKDAKVNVRGGVFNVEPLISGMDKNDCFDRKMVEECDEVEETPKKKLFVFVVNNSNVIFNDDELFYEENVMLRLSDSIVKFKNGHANSLSINTMDACSVDMGEMVVHDLEINLKTDGSFISNGLVRDKFNGVVHGRGFVHVDVRADVKIYKDVHGPGRLCTHITCVREI